MKHVHLIGIGGTGLSSIARVLIEMGYTVSGSDRTDSAQLNDLRQIGVTVYVSHHASQVAEADLVIRSSAIPDDNPEVQAALALNIRVLKRNEFFNEFLRDRQMIAVAGTHGKTTTTAMIAWMLTRLGLEPGFIIGGVARNLGVSARAGKGVPFVIEADEYDYMFHGLHPTFAVITMVEHDHPDCFPTPALYLDAFRGFVQNIVPNGSLIVCKDDPGAAAMALSVPPHAQSVTYGFERSALYRAEKRTMTSTGSHFYLINECATHVMPLAEVKLQLTGEHVIRDALAALTVAHRMGLPMQAAADALGEFVGTGRRFEVIGEAAGMVFIDDYAHHPTEIQATLAAARQRYPDRRIWAVWQPHTFSRTHALEERFASSFDQADQVIVTAIYAARETNPGYSADAVVRRMHSKNTRYVPTLAGVSKTLLAEMQPGDVLLVMSAGDANEITRKVYDAMHEREAHLG